MKPKRLGVFFLIGFGVCGVLRAADLDALAARSPFASPAIAGAIKPQEPDALEFRGLVVDERGTTYSLFDVNAKRSYWVREGGKGLIRVKNFDPEECLLEVEQNGRTLTLPLRSAAIATSAPVPVPAVARVRVRRRDSVVILPAVTENDPRAERIAAEVRRRRAARLAAAESAGTNPPSVLSVTPSF